MKIVRKNGCFDWQKIKNNAEYDRWKADRLNAARRSLVMPPVEIGSLGNPSPQECSELLRRCEANNYAHYACSDTCSAPEETRIDLRKFTAVFGLQIAETHRSAGEAGIVALQPSEKKGKREYIPYSTHRMNWHTDGYYNSPRERISAFVIHCVRQATSGGVNQILNPEIAYIRLRDENPNYLNALMHEEAMTIPENREANGKVRPDSVGPVFYPDPDTGEMQMRYSARIRSIRWRDEPLTREAADFLRKHLINGDPLMHELRLEPGQGVINNNVLHNRTSFDMAGNTVQNRLIFRVRFLNRVTRM